MQARLATLEPPSTPLNLGRAEYLGQIDGLVYGDNPRNGFFRGSVFLHPDLRFRLDFPQGWQHQNLAQAVMGVSPQQNAAIQLTLAQGDPLTAARQFLAQQGVRAGQTTRETINGLPAVVSYFQAQTEQGVLQGLVAFLSYEDRTYRLLGYTPAQQFQQYDRLFRQAIGSFAPLADPQVLAVQPNRMDIVRLEEEMTLSEFNRRYPSAVSQEELALINQVADVNARFPAGTLVKRVVPGDT